MLIINEGTAIIGWNRDEDSLNFTGLPSVTDFITVTEQSFEIANIKLSSTNNTGGTVLLKAVNYNAPDYNAGRDKVLTIINCQFRNCFDVWFIEGFDLVDIQNTLVWYIEATTIGCQFKNVSKLQISSCEYVRWFDETLIGTSAFNPALSYLMGNKVIEAGTFYESLAGSVAGPFNPVEWTAVGYATTPMVELLDNAGGSGFGAVNISGCVIHPQQTQDGINISDLATIGFGTIASNTGIDIGLDTGVIANFDYDIQNSTIVQANQGITNGNSFATMSLVGNAVYLDNSATNPMVLKGSNTVGGGGFTNPITFPTSQRTINTVADGSITYNSKIPANFIVVVTATVQQSGNGVITMRLRNSGTPITFAVGTTEIRSAIADTLSFSVIGQATFGDVFDVEVESSGGADVLVSEFILNGYQF